MRKLLVLLFMLSIIPFALADEWDDIPDVERVWDGQKSVTNKEFEEVVNALEAKDKKKEEKQRKKKIKKISGGGNSLHPEMSPNLENIPELEKLKSKDEGFLVNIPVNLVVGGKIVDKGYYKAIAEKKDGKAFVNFYQSQFLIFKLEVNETQDDYGEEELDFAKMLPYNESFMKFIFGSIDFNAYAYVPYLN